MEKNKDLKLIFLVVIIGIFSVSYFIIANQVSYALNTDYDLTSTQSEKVATIKACAEKYGEDNTTIFEKEDTAYIKVEDLIAANYLATNNDGKVIDISNNKVMNDEVIKIKKENDKISVEVNS